MINKTQFLLLALFFLFLTSIEGQITFKNGYFIDNTGNKINCKIKDKDKKYTPTAFTYILENDSKEYVRGLENTQEFSLKEGGKYIRVKVDIDKSKSGVSNLKNKMNMEYEEEVVFLKVLLEGGSSLYEYKEAGLERYFYKVGDGPIRQLDYKKYKVGSGTIRENNRYRQQLKLEMSCELSDKNIESLEYKKKVLIKFFKDFNNCTNAKFELYDDKVKRKKINIGIRYEGMFSKNTLFFRGDELFDFENKLVSQFGLSFEYIMPFNRNKWRFFMEPTYYKYESESSLTVEYEFNPDIEYTFRVENRAIELPLGVRYYMFLSKEMQLFIGAGYYVDVYSRTELDVTTTTFLQTESEQYSGEQSIGNVFAGFGIQYNRFSVDYRYKRGKDFAVNTTGWFTAYRGSSISIRINLL